MLFVRDDSLSGFEARVANDFEAFIPNDKALLAPQAKAWPAKASFFMREALSITCQSFFIYFWFSNTYDADFSQVVDSSAK